MRYTLRRLVECSIGKKIDVHVCFIDYSKSFNTVKHKHLIQLLQSLDVDVQDNKRLAIPYCNQQAATRHNGEISKTIDIKQGVWQGCIASPHLFSLYREMTIRGIDVMEGGGKGWWQCDKKN